MKKCFLLTAILFFSAISFAQISTPTEDSIKQTINTFFKGMSEKDTTLIRTTMTSGMIMQTIGQNKNKETVITTDPVESWFNQIVNLPASIKKVEEKIVFEKILIDGAMAIVWAPFELYFNDKFYSCGVNQFGLVKINNEWKVNYIIDTRRKICK